MVTNVVKRDKKESRIAKTGNVLPLLTANLRIDFAK